MFSLSPFLNSDFTMGYKQLGNIPDLIDFIILSISLVDVILNFILGKGL
jgi:hypothetical protein